MYALIGLGEPQPTVSCRGWEKDPESFSKRVAEHYARTVLGKSMSARRIVPYYPSGDKRFMEVQFAPDLAVGVSFVKIPDYVIALRLRAQPPGPARYYTYSCTPDGNLILSEQKKPSAVPASPTMRVAPGNAGRTVGWLGETAPQSIAPAFRFLCPPGCAPNATNACIGIVRRAIQDAIWLAENAAEQLTARDDEAVRLFRSFFGDPERLVPWANNRPAADLVAGRFRAVGRGFRTRVPHIRCAVVGPGAEQCAGENAFALPRSVPTATLPLPRNTIHLCPPFWSVAPAGTVSRFWRAAILLHEMLHLLFWEFFGHQANLPRAGDPEERRRDNSHCYEAFALRVAKQGADPNDVTVCNERPF